MRHRQTKGPDTDRPDLNNRVTSRLYTFTFFPFCTRYHPDVIDGLAKILNLDACSSSVQNSFEIYRRQAAGRDDFEVRKASFTKFNNALYLRRNPSELVFHLRALAPNVLSNLRRR
jgi:hypothetical protein